MNKKQKIAHWKRMMTEAGEMKAVARQNFKLAAQIESTANTALKELGVQPGRARKGNELPIDLVLKLKAGLESKPKSA